MKFPILDPWPFEGWRRWRSLSQVLAWALFDAAEISVSGYCWEQRHHPFFALMVRVIDGVTSPGHCEASAAWHRERRGT